MNTLRTDALLTIPASVKGSHFKSAGWIGANRLAPHKIATNLQFVKTTVLGSTVKQSAIKPDILVNFWFYCGAFLKSRICFFFIILSLRLSTEYIYI